MTRDSAREDYPALPVRLALLVRLAGLPGVAAGRPVEDARALHELVAGDIPASEPLGQDSPGVGFWAIDASPATAARPSLPRRSRKNAVPSSSKNKSRPIEAPKNGKTGGGSTNEVVPMVVEASLQRNEQ